MAQDALASVFGAEADEYDRLRPSPPTQALDWLLAGADRPVHDVVDVGAGTGLMTRALLARGLAVVAVEPDDRMAVVLRRRVPGVEVVAGVAEALPVADESCDAVTFASSFHWADPQRAVPETARVLRPGGVLAAVWTSADDDVAWVAAMRDATWAVDGDRWTPELARRFSEVTLPTAAPFVAVEKDVVRFERRMSPEEVIALSMTVSVVIAMSDDERSEVRERLQATLAQANLPQDADGDVVLPCAARVWRARRD